jgi:hypothetical protein
MLYRLLLCSAWGVSLLDVGRQRNRINDEYEFEREETLIHLVNECRQCCWGRRVLVGLSIYYMDKISVSFILNLFIGNMIVKVWRIVPPFSRCILKQSVCLLQLLAYFFSFIYWLNPLPEHCIFCSIAGTKYSGLEFTCSTTWSFAMLWGTLSVLVLFYFSNIIQDGKRNYSTNTVKGKVIPALNW